MASAALARRNSSKTTRRSNPPARRSTAIRRAGGALARKAAGAAAGAVRRARESQKTKGLLYGTGGAVAGAIAEVKLAARLPATMPMGLPAQLLLGALSIGAGFAFKGKIAEALVLGGQGPFFAGASSLAKRLASGGTLAGEFDGENYGQRGGVTAVEGEFDDIARG